MTKGRSEDRKLRFLEKKALMKKKNEKECDNGLSGLKFNYMFFLLTTVPHVFQIFFRFLFPILKTLKLPKSKVGVLALFQTQNESNYQFVNFEDNFSCI